MLAGESWGPGGTGGGRFLQAQCLWDNRWEDVIPPIVALGPEKSEGDSGQDVDSYLVCCSIVFIISAASNHTFITSRLPKATQHEWRNNCLGSYSTEALSPDQRESPDQVIQDQLGSLGRGGQHARQWLSWVRKLGLSEGFLSAVLISPLLVLLIHLWSLPHGASLSSRCLGAWSLPVFIVGDGLHEEPSDHVVLWPWSGVQGSSSGNHYHTRCLWSSYWFSAQRIQGISDLHAVSAAAASQTKGDSDPFLEFLILLYFVTDCEELCDAKCTV